jgi:hypothetical protein
MDMNLIEVEAVVISFFKEDNAYALLPVFKVL